MKKLSFRQTWDNIMLIMNYYRRFTPFYLYAYTFYVFLVSFVWVASGSYSLKYIIDALEQRKSFQEIMIFLLAISGLMILRNIMGAYLVEYFQMKANVTMMEKLREELFLKAVKMDLAYYETPKFYTDFVWAASQADSKCQEVKNTYFQFMARVSELLFLGGLMVSLDPAMILFAVAAAAGRFLFSLRLVKEKYALDIKVKPIERERDYSQRIFYLADYAKEIRLSRVHELLYERFRSATARMREIYEKGGKKLRRLENGGQLFQESFMTLFMMLYLTWQITVRKSISVGDFAALVLAANRFARRIRQFADVMRQFTESALYVEKFRSFLNYRPAIERQEGKKPGEQPRALTLSDVSFTYEGEEKPSLSHINMTIRPYEKIAVVGYNGAGKSTLVKLLMRLYDVSEGAVYLGNTDIREFATEEYRGRFGAVFQDFQIFAATLGENVAMDTLLEEERKKAAVALERCGMGEKLQSLQRGLDTPLTREFYEDGVSLSGGEGQKTAIARVFMRPFQYVIMDEPSSALDPVSEYRFNQNMMEIAKDKTVIFISHRLSTTCMADRIYMLEKGRIIEEGTHHELMARKGKYAEMFLKQAGKYVSE